MKIETNISVNKKNMINLETKDNKIKSLPHQASETYINTLANPNINDNMNHISVASYLIDSNFPPRNKRQLDGISDRLTNYFTELYKKTPTLPLFLLLGFQVNVNATNKQIFGRSGDKHAIVFSLLDFKDSYCLEIFDSNGPLILENYPFDYALLQVASGVAKQISKQKWAKKCTVRQFKNPNLNFGLGHCDLLGITYIEGRYRYPNKDRVLLEKFNTFATYPEKKKSQIVENITQSIQQNVSIIRKMVPETFKLPIVSLKDA